MASKRTSLERISDRELAIKRSFRAPAAIVFDAWTRPEYVRRWWAPASRGVSLVECEADVRPGGTYRYVMARGESQRFTFFGRYLEITRPSRLVYTQSFESPDAEAVVTVTFQEREGATMLVVQELYPSKEALDGALTSGMEDGMRETFEQLDALVTALAG